LGTRNHKTHACIKAGAGLLLSLSTGSAVWLEVHRQVAAAAGGAAAARAACSLADGGARQHCMVLESLSQSN
jgi:hypothetical protein